MAARPLHPSLERVVRHKLDDADGLMNLSSGLAHRGGIVPRLGILVGTEFDVLAAPNWLCEAAQQRTKGA